MATPNGARHRDLEQRLRDIESALRSLTGTALRRQQLSVTSGDFVVSGGGDVVVRDGGQVEVLYPTGEVAFTLGGVDLTGEGDLDGAQFQMLEEDGASNVVTIYRVTPRTGFPDGLTTMQLASDTFTLSARDYVLIGGGSVGQLNLDASGVTLGGGLFADDVTISPRGTTGSAANVRFNASGRLLEVTSSRRFKADIKDAPDRADELLAVKGRTWRDKGEDADNTKQRHVGYIAEELHDAGLTEYVEYDAEGLPHAIQYDRLTVPLVQLVQRQQAQIDALADRLDALEQPAPLPNA